MGYFRRNLRFFCGRGRAGFYEEDVRVRPRGRVNVYFARRRRAERVVLLFQSVRCISMLRKPCGDFSAGLSYSKQKLNATANLRLDVTMKEGRERWFSSAVYSYLLTFLWLSLVILHFCCKACCTMGRHWNAGRGRILRIAMSWMALPTCQ